MHQEVNLGVWDGLPRVHEPYVSWKVTAHGHTCSPQPLGARQPRRRLVIVEVEVVYHLGDEQLCRGARVVRSQNECAVVPHGVLLRSNARGKLRRSEAEGTNRRSLLASA